MLFCDVKGFTILSARLGPVKLVALLDDLFRRIDGYVSRVLGIVLPRLLAPWVGQFVLPRCSARVSLLVAPRLSSLTRHYQRRRRYYSLCLRHGVEKIKTIGDAYMAATGLEVRTWPISFRPSRTLFA